MAMSLFSKKVTSRIPPFDAMKTSISAAIDTALADGVDPVDILQYVDGLIPHLTLKADAASDRRRFANHLKPPPWLPRPKQFGRQKPTPKPLRNSTALKKHDTNVINFLDNPNTNTQRKYPNDYSH
jgi:hypothetical protein